MNYHKKPVITKIIYLTRLMMQKAMLNTVRGEKKLKEITKIKKKILFTPLMKRINTKTLRMITKIFSTMQLGMKRTSK